MEKYEQKHVHTFKRQQKTIFDSLTIKDRQFKKESIDTKVTKVIEPIDNVPAPNIYERRQGQNLTPLLEGKIQYGKLLKAHNLEAVRDEVTV